MSVDISEPISITYPPPSITKNLSFGSPQPFLIGVAGGSSSGKTKVCQKIISTLLEKDRSTSVKVVRVRLSDFYRILTKEELRMANKGCFNFDTPEAIDFVLFNQFLEKLKNNEVATVPKYDYKNHVRLDQSNSILNPDVVILEGIFILYSKDVRDSLNLKVFVDVDDDDRLASQVLRDTEKFNRKIDYVLNQYVRFVKPGFEEYILPSKRFADVIIPRGKANTVAIELLASHIDDIIALKKSERSHFREKNLSHSPLRHKSSRDSLKESMQSLNIDNSNYDELMK
ncbi:Uridine-cytidine kinase-like 1 [Clydaea vesicula]|uniref:uridine/cytidine kinase n=1 Tax=Clydaea vesicula TaxID=447962 RepID=A0AAD5Y251_9FUNG|nr:Uridine-cytidine kinase-like 1 [Clydaea vesicula]KAJ3384376.1 Uridine-cytidine kinase-like 1 [Lobulomyces angularis]